MEKTKKILKNLLLAVGVHKIFLLASCLCIHIIPGNSFVVSTGSLGSVYNVQGKLDSSDNFNRHRSSWAALHASIVESNIPMDTIVNDVTTQMQKPSTESNFLTGKGTQLTPMFDFGSFNDTVATRSIEAFDRIDDVIMGGISSSTLQLVRRADLKAASWSGVVRIDGGGFCGFRTLPFLTPYNVTGQDGLYLKLRLDSDNEPHRRVWKVTVRTEPSRGEVVYQATISIPPSSSFSSMQNSFLPTADDRPNQDETTLLFHTIFVPFKDFKMVRGPRMISDGPAIDLSTGLYQVGMTCSKFQMAVNTTQLENFRPGYFNLMIKEIGLFQNEEPNIENEHAFLAQNTSTNIAVPQTLSKEESKKKVPLFVKFLRPVSKLFFTEKGNRRKSAMKILKTKRGMSHLKAFAWGVAYRTRASGLITGGILQTVSIMGIDSLRFVLGSFIRYGLFLPVRTLSRMIRIFKKYVLRMKTKEMPSME